MRRLLVFILTVSLFLSFIPSKSHSIIAVSSGSVSQANMRSSLVNGTAFVDFSSAGALTPYIGYKLTICSVTDPTQCASGYIKAAGAAETLGAELHTDANAMSDPNANEANATTGWSAATPPPTWESTAAGTPAVGTWHFHVVSDAGYKGFDRVNWGGHTNKGLFKHTFNVKVVSGAMLCVFRNGLQTTSYINIVYTDAAYTAKSVYFTSMDTGDLFSTRVRSSNGAAEFYEDNYSAKQVLTPSATGVTIVSAYGNSTYNWTSNTFGTQANDFAGFTYSIYPGAVSATVNDTNTHSYQLVDCADAVGTLGVDVTAAATLYNYTVVRCPAGAFQFEETATLKNSIGISTGNDITIATGKTVTGTSNLLGDSAKAGVGTYTNAAGTQWNADPLFISTSDFRLQSGSPAINAGVIFPSGSVTNPNIRISAVNGTAFVDFTDVAALIPYLGKKLTIVDSEGARLIGYIKAAGSAETLGSELFTDPSFDAVTKATAKSVTGITKANPGVVTFGTGHGYVNGDIIYFSGLSTMTELNTQYWQLRANSGDTFQLATVYDTTSLDTSGYVLAEVIGGNCAQRVTFTNWTVAYPTWVVGVDGAGALTGKAVNVGAGANQVIYQAPTTSANWLLKLVTNCDALTAGTYAGYITSTYLSLDAVNTVGAVNWYGTNYNANSNNGVDAKNSLAASFTSLSLKQVLTPSATGVTIVSASGGSTYNWSFHESGFNMNDSGGYTYTIDLDNMDYAGRPIQLAPDIGAYETESRRKRVN